MKIVRVFTGDDGKSHFEDLDVPLTVEHEFGSMSEPHPAQSVIFRSTPADYDAGFHNAPRRQYVVVLEGALEVETGDGSKRLLSPGDILLGEDTTGEGHITRAVGGQPGRSLFIPLA